MKKNLFVFALITMLVAGCASGIQISAPVQSTPAPNGEIRVPAVNIQLNAPGQNPMVNTTDSSGKTAGILLGIWHGIISPVTMVMSFVNENVQMYEVHNDGSQYNLGFLLGTGIIFLILGGLIGSRR
jgi:hypothetical protein